jgi:hypothetical protein
MADNQTLANLLRQKLQSAVDFPSTVVRNLTDPQAFLKSFGYTPSQQLSGFSAGYAGVPAKPPSDIGVLDPNNIQYGKGYESGEETGLATGILGGTAALTKPIAKPVARAIGQEAWNRTEKMMQQQGLMPGVVPVSKNKNITIDNTIKKIDPSEYRGTHQPPPPGSEMASLFHQMDMIMPKDVYSVKGKQYYGIGDKTIDDDWWKPMMRAKGNPNYEIEVYRAVPKGVTEINSGDWVSPSRKYVEGHGENALKGEYDIISKKVPASTLTSEGYPYELGYFQPTRKDIIEQQIKKIE